MSNMCASSIRHGPSKYWGVVLSQTSPLRFLSLSQSFIKVQIPNFRGPGRLWKFVAFLLSRFALTIQNFRFLLACGIPEADEYTGYRLLLDSSLANQINCGTLSEKNNENNNSLSAICNRRAPSAGGWNRGISYHWHTGIPGGHFWPLPAGL